MQWITYEEMIADKPAMVAKVLDFNGVKVPAALIPEKIAEIEGDKERTRFNKGQIGRGQDLVDEAQRQRINSLARHFPSTDFGLIGVTR